ncbi:MAG: cell division protein FtsZ [Candidatus Nealsonbacteria bacterium]|nr:cell division protein FtsZ [Candidatus Nealsonbacteria bacterium]
MEKTIRIKVIGVGGSGSNAVSRMAKCSIEGVELIAVNTDVQDLKTAKADQKISIGKAITNGLGTGMNPARAESAAEEDRENLKNILKGADLAFITCGMGGGTGTGAAPVIAEILKELGILTVAVVTTPFSFEGRERSLIASKGVDKLRDRVDTLITVSNDKIFKLIDSKTSVDSAFWMCDEVLRQAVQGISDLIVLPGIVNIDFADVKAILKNSGSALFGIGRAQGDNRAKEAALAALNSPLIDVSSNKAKGVLFSVSGGEDISLAEIDEIAKVIKDRVSSDAKIIFGAVQDEKLKNGEIKVTIVATGFQT